jgi:hypothetical protein
MLRTGTSKNGRVYRYYTCSSCATKGKTVCKGRSIPMEKLDRLVTDHLIERLFKPERLAAILSSISTRRAQKAESVSSRLMALQQEVADAEEKLARLYRLVEEGLTDLDDVLKVRLAALKADRDRAKAALERAKEQLRPQIQIDPALIERFGRVMRENLSTGSVPFRKAYLQSLIASIEVDDHKVRIRGSKDLLEKAVLWNQNGQVWCSQMSTEWRAAFNTNIVIAEERLGPPCPATTAATRLASGCPRAFAIPLSSSQKAHSREMLVRWPATLSECWTIFPAASRWDSVGLPQGHFEAVYFQRPRAFGRVAPGTATPGFCSLAGRFVLAATARSLRTRRRLTMSPMFSRMILSKKSPTYWDLALALLAKRVDRDDLGFAFMRLCSRPLGLGRFA